MERSGFTIWGFRVWGANVWGAVSYYGPSGVKVSGARGCAFRTAALLGMSAAGSGLFRNG